jgi:hypothetical protein
MAAGVIPMVTYEASIDVQNFGVLFEDSSIETIIRQVRKVASMSADELSHRAKKAWETAHRNNTPEKFERAYRDTVEMILAKHGKR